MVTLIAEPVASDQMAERVVRKGEVFLIQKLRAVKSVTLQQDVGAGFGFGRGRLPAGGKLIYATDGQGGVFYCGVLRAMKIPLNGNLDRQWYCLEDKDGDQVFDTLYRTTYNRGAFLPVFDQVYDDKAVMIPYTPDKDEDRFYFETGFARENALANFGASTFTEKVREEGTESWAPIADGSMYGGSTPASERRLPMEIKLDRAQFTVVAADGDQVTVHPDAVKTGVVHYSSQSCGAGSRRLC